VHFDAIASVRAAWTPGEIQQIAEEAGLHAPRIERCWPARWTLWWKR
jgi:hypothetical protein